MVGQSGRASADHRYVEPICLMQFSVVDSPANNRPSQTGQRERTIRRDRHRESERERERERNKKKKTTSGGPLLMVKRRIPESFNPWRDAT